MSQTIIAKMYHHAINQPERPAFRFINDSGEHSNRLTYKQLWDEADVIAQFLKTKAAPGARVMLFFPPGLAYIKAFYGCLLAGMVAVPLYPPRRNAKSDRVVKIAQCCQAQVAITTEAMLNTVEAIWQKQNQTQNQEEHLPLTFFATDALPSTDHQRAVVLPTIDADSIAFLQYTSGSTGAPKGVMISHQNIVANIEHLALMGNANETDIFVNWLPLFHDLGLVTAILMPTYLGAKSVLMAPASFIRHPMVWLKAIEHYGGTVGGAPNFAYDLCVEKVTDIDMGAGLGALDLSSWRVAFNAAEPVRADTIAQFAKHFAPCGFKSSAIYPSYGMAEATVFITGGDSATNAPVVYIDIRALADNKVVLVSEETPGAAAFVGCGGALPPHDLRIVDGDTGVERGEAEIGEIWFSGPSVSPGYWQLAELSAQTFGQQLVGDVGGDVEGKNEKRYFRSGDLGFVSKGELFVTGRIKDLLIIHGKNYYPQDIEHSTTKAHEAMRANHCAVFADHHQGDEQIIIVAELLRAFARRAKDDNYSAEIISAVRQQVYDEHQINVAQVVLISPGTIPMTSSGKIQRHKTSQHWQAGELRIVGESPNHAAEQSTGAVKREMVAPSTEAEQVIHAIWCRELRLDELSITDGFFDVGGNSLAAIAISGEICKQFDAVRLDPEQLLADPSVEQMAGFIELAILHAEQGKARAEAKAGGGKRKTVRI